MLVAIGITLALPGQSIYAAQITARTLAISSSSPAASNATTTYTFTFTVPTTGTPIKSVGVQICTNANVDIGGTCTAPTGFSSTAGPAGLASQPTGLGSASGWTIDGTEPAANDLYISNSSNATNPSGSQTVVFNKVQNPTTANQTFFARITTYSDSAWTTAIDAGTVAASTTNPIVLTGTMPESLIFCTGGQISVNGNGIPDCTTATSGNITFTQLFSPTSTVYASSQMAASTNASQGYAITVSGTTLTSGTNTVKAIGTTGVTSASTVGSSSFGFNLAADTDPAALALTPPSAAATPAANGTNYMGVASTGFNTGGNATTATYEFNASGSNTVAKSDNGTGTAGPTDSQIFTTTYMVNVSGSQPAGTYTATLTYICTPTF